MNEAFDLGYSYERECGNCAQCVLAAIQDIFGMVDDSVFRAAHGLAGGVGLGTLGTCGALAGAVLFVGQLKGRRKADFTSGGSKESYGICKRIADDFKTEYGGILCYQVQQRLMGASYDLSDRHQLEQYKAAGGGSDHCPAVVGWTVRYIAELLVNGLL